jgi:hypothetical protein
LELNKFEIFELSFLTEPSVEINYQNFLRQTISIEDFCLRSKFTLEDFAEIPNVHRNQIKPLTLQSTEEIAYFIRHLHTNVPFQKGLFQFIDKAKILKGNETQIKKWFYRRGLSFDQKIILYIDDNNSFLLTWKIFIKYFKIFYLYRDDISVFEESLDWALLVYHEDEIYFGTNKSFDQSNEFSEYTFSW